MTILRAMLIPLVLLAYVAVATPLEWLTRRLAPSARGWSAPWLARLLLALLRIRVEAHGLGALRPGALVVANHVSWVDILVVASLRPVRFLAKAEVGAWPLVAAIARAQGTIFVDRARRRSILPANAAIVAALSCGDIVVIFPEGTTGAGDDVLSFRSSHLQPACEAARRANATAPVVPLALSYENAHAAWIGEATLAPHIWDMLRGAPSRCRVAIGAPHQAGPSACRKALAVEMRDRVRRLRLVAPPVSPSPSRSSRPPCPSSPRSTSS